MTEGEVGAVAPVVNAPAADAVPTPGVPAGQESVEGQTPESVQPKTLTEDEHKELVDKRVNERLTKERRRLERTIRAELERDFYKQQVETRQQPKAEQAPGRPRQEDYVGRPYDEFAEALAEWKADQKLAKFREELQQQSAQQRQRQTANDHVQYVHENIITKGQEKFEDFDRVFEVDGITEPMVASAADLPNGADVLYHLSHKDAERLRIAAMRPAQQAFALKDLSEKLAAPPKPTNAPPPIVPNSGKAPVEKRLQDANIDEFFEIRARQIAARRKR